MGNWYNTGWSGLDEEAERRKRGTADGKPRWFWVGISDGEQKRHRDFVFLDDFDHMRPDVPNDTVVPVRVRLHHIVVDEDRRNRLRQPCTRQGQPCVWCQRSFKSQYTGVFSVLDITPWTRTVEAADGSGSFEETNITPEVKLFGGVLDTLKLLQDRKEDLGNLQGWLFKSSRFDTKHPQVGSNFVHREKIEDLEAWLREKGYWPEDDSLDLAPYGLDPQETMDYYIKQLSPMSREEAHRLLNTHRCTDGLVWNKSGSAAQSSRTSGASTSSDVVDYGD